MLEDVGSTRLGILGGTFDPVHAGHVAAANAAATGLQLETVLFIPNANPPHKKEKKITSYDNRVRMLEITLEDCEAGELCELESRNSSPNYSIDTIRKLRKLYGNGTAFFFIIGSDELPDLPSWKDPEKLIEAATIVVISRAGYEIQVSRLKRSLDEDAVEKILSNVIYADLPDVSSSKLRKKAALGEDLGEDVHPDVAQYIAQHNLYS